MGRKHHLEHLRSVPLFRSLNDKELRAIARTGDEETVPAGTVLMREGDTGDDGFVIVDGEVTVSKKGRKIVALGAGAIVGELALVEAGERTATVTAAVDTTILRFHRRQFLLMLDDAPTLTTKLLQTLASRVRELDRTAFG